MPQRLTNIKVRRVSFVDRAAVRDPANPTQPQRFVLFKNEGSVPAKPREEGVHVSRLTHAQKAELDPAILAIVEKAEETAAEAETALEKARKETADEKAAREKAEQERDGRPPVKKAEEPEEINKDELPAAVRAALEKSEKDAADARAEAEAIKAQANEAHEIAKAERDRRETGEWIAKAETGEYRGLPGAPADVGPVLKSAHDKLSKEEWGVLDTMFKAAAAQIKEGLLFKTQGKDGVPPAPDSPMAEITRKAEELRKSDSSLSQSDAFQRVLRSDRDLAARYAADAR